MFFKAHINLKIVAHSLMPLYWVTIVLILSINVTHAFFAPIFSDCLEDDSDEYDQLEACQILLQTNSKRRDLHVALAKILEQQKKNKQLITTYQNALLIFPDDKYFINKLNSLNGVKQSTKKENIKKTPIKQNIVKQDSIKPPPVKQALPPKKTKQKNITPLAKSLKIKKSIKFSPEQTQFIDQLRLLKSLKNQQIISQSEYDKRKNELLDANFRVAKTAEIKNTQSIKTKTIIKKSEPIFDGLNFGKYHALIIGNNKYKYLPQLKTAVNDAQSLATLLKKEYGFKVKLLLNANRYDTLKALGKLRNTLTKNDNLLIYYAGHGVLDEASERGYWLPVDAEKDFTSNWISTAEITDTLKALQSWHVLVVADSCYSGTLVRSAPITFKNPIEKQLLIKRLLKKKSRTAITSGGLEPVADSGGGNHSVFAQAFLNVLQNNNNIIEAEDVFSRLRDKVILNADQTPEYSNVRKVGHNGGDFIFKRH
ncbi:MAG: caspase family protein [Pseudomonadota bacterium]